MSRTTWVRAAASASRSGRPRRPRGAPPSPCSSAGAIRASTRPRRRRRSRRSRPDDSDGDVAALGPGATSRASYRRVVAERNDSGGDRVAGRGSRPDRGRSRPLRSDAAASTRWRPPGSRHVPRRSRRASRRRPARPGNDRRVIGPERVHGAAVPRRRQLAERRATTATSPRAAAAARRTMRSAGPTRRGLEKCSVRAWKADHQQDVHRSPRRPGWRYAGRSIRSRRRMRSIDSQDAIVQRVGVLAVARPRTVIERAPVGAEIPADGARDTVDVLVGRAGRGSGSRTTGRRAPDSDRRTRPGRENAVEVGDRDVVVGLGFDGGLARWRRSGSRSAGSSTQTSWSLCADRSARRGPLRRRGRSASAGDVPLVDCWRAIELPAEPLELAERERGGQLGQAQVHPRSDGVHRRLARGPGAPTGGPPRRGPGHATVRQPPSPGGDLLVSPRG